MKSRTSPYTVITGDITHFTALAVHDRKKIIADTEKFLSSITNKHGDAQIFRGDSYQIVLDDITQALRRAIQLICWFKVNHINGARSESGTRLSIGIGQIDYRGKSVLDSDGEAFHLSGRAFDTMKRDEILILSTSDDERNRLYQIILTYINMIIRQWTVSQATTIYQMLSLENATQEDIAKALKMSQPAVAKSLSAARWKELEKGMLFINDELKTQYSL